MGIDGIGKSINRQLASESETSECLRRRARDGVGSGKVLGDRDQVKRYEMLQTALLTVAHEVRTPLTTISAYVDLLSRDLSESLDESARKKFIVMRRCIQNLTRMAADLADAALLETNTLALKSESFPAGDVIQDACDIIAPQIEDANQCLVIRQADPSCRVEADKGRLVQVLTNFLSNASRHAPAGSEIKMDCRLTAEWMTVDVSDTGPGITPRDIARMRHEHPWMAALERSETSNVVFGLGFHICKAIIDLHAGVLRLDGTPERGTVAGFTIPRLASTAAILSDRNLS